MTASEFYETVHAIKAAHEKIDAQMDEIKKIYEWIYWALPKLKREIDNLSGALDASVIGQGDQIRCLKFSVRVATCLENENIKTIGELARMSDHDLLRIPNFGKCSLKEVRRELASRAALP